MALEHQFSSLSGRTTMENDPRSPERGQPAKSWFENLHLGVAERLASAKGFLNLLSKDLSSVIVLSDLSDQKPRLFESQIFRSAFEDVMERLTLRNEGQRLPIDLMYLIEMPGFLSDQGWLDPQGREKLRLFSSLSREAIADILAGGRTDRYFKLQGAQLKAKNPPTVQPDGGAKELTQPQLLLLYVEQMDAFAQELGHRSGAQMVRWALAKGDELVRPIVDEDPEAAKALAILPAQFYPRFIVGVLYTAFLKSTMGKDFPFVVPPRVKINLD